MKIKKRQGCTKRKGNVVEECASSAYVRRVLLCRKIGKFAVKRKSSGLCVGEIKMKGGSEFKPVVVD
ncbi:hypothetical protein QJS04_geneDACA018067 [Acorus gramineus]|uniref:Uncharacterized protein n=1 Tax=Acorus gramineus TaxID=55184 RepID=A0AAV9A8M1_ACOGR|nr:hypothetical protein QJS04_geneDACA018067 [Acorus gramineus]